MVASGLVGLLTVTSGLLMVLAPPPLNADPYPTLSASDVADRLDPKPDPSLDTIFNTRTPVQSGRWKYIYVHQSATNGGDAVSLAAASGIANGPGDHFVIGNGNGMKDGEIQVSPRWNEQTAPMPPAGADQIDPDCISICVVGDFRKARPSSTQLHRLTQLVATLQGQFQVPQDNVVLLDSGTSPAAGIGSNFPTGSFRQQILR